MNEEMRGVYFVLLSVCLAFSFMFSLCETAFLSLQRIRMKHLERTDVAQADVVAKIMKRPERFLSGVLLGNNLANSGAAALATALAISFWQGRESTAVIIGTIGVTAIVLVFGEITPKTIAINHSERVALFLARPVEVFLWILTPLLEVLSRIASGIAKLTGGTSGPKTVVPVTEDEIRNMITVGQEEGLIPEAQAEMLHNIFEFGIQPVSIVMAPRPDIIWVQLGAKLADFHKIYSQTPYSRFPVFREDIDDVVGVVSAKDVLLAEARNEISQNSPIDDIIRPIMFIPKTKHVGEAFTEMRSADSRMAVVVDEFGTIAGVITLERLLEEIVGQLGDEIRGPDKIFETIDEHTFDVDGTMRLEEANEELGLKLPLGNYETIAGFMLTWLGHIPKENEHMRYGNLRFIVTKMHGLRIDGVRIIKGVHEEPHHSP